MNGLVPVISGMLMYVFAERWPAGRRGAAWRVAATPIVAAALLMIPMFSIAAALHAEVPSALRWLASALGMVICLWGLCVLARLGDREVAVPGRERGLLSLLARIAPRRAETAPER
jgi:hypothetical protein